jgi:hypothetical protein
MRLYPVLIFAALLFGCAHHGPQAIDPPSPKKSYIIPFERTESGLLIVSAVININPNHPEVRPPAKRLALDTGCARTCFFVSDEAISELSKVIPNAKLDESRIADGRPLRVCEFNPAEVTIGNLSVDIPVDASGYELTLDMPLDGCLGIDFLSRFNVQIDFRAKTVTLTER